MSEDGEQVVQDHLNDSGVEKFFAEHPEAVDAAEAEEDIVDTDKESWDWK